MQRRSCVRALVLVAFAMPLFGAPARAAADEFGGDPYKSAPWADM